MSHYLSCPCCGTSATEARCRACGHVWHPGNSSERPIDYSGQAGRNALPAPYVERKLSERAVTLQARLRPGMRLLEVGCAEGRLGACIKAGTELTYWGIEPSRDAEAARLHLDAVFRDSSELPADTPPFDGILSFHVLEHIPRISEEIARWRTLLHDEGWLLLEVPCRSGHADLLVDHNPEHLHCFSPASLACLLERAGFDTLSVGRGFFESPVYTDSLRVLAVPGTSAEAKRRRLLRRFATIPAPFAIFGLGGDFRNYVEPILDQLPVKLLLDNNPQLTGTMLGGFRVVRYCPSQHAQLPVLVCSLRHEASILACLREAHHPEDHIHLLADIYCDGLRS